jgi:hypothetical protein
MNCYVVWVDPFCLGCTKKSTEYQNLSASDIHTMLCLVQSHNVLISDMFERVHVQYDDKQGADWNVRAPEQRESAAL